MRRNTSHKLSYLMFKWKLSLTYKISFFPNLFCAKEEIVSYLEFLSQITHKFRKSTNTPIRDFIFISSFHPSNFESFKNSLSQFNCWIASGKCFNTFSACKKNFFMACPLHSRSSISVSRQYIVCQRVKLESVRLLLLCYIQ